MGKGKKSRRDRVAAHAWEEHVDAASRMGRRPRGRGIAPLDAEFEPYEGNAEITPNGLVVSPYGKLAFVEHEGGERLCQVDPKLVRGKATTLAPGDRVLVEAESGTHVVRDMAPRRTKLSRAAVGTRREQVFAANVNLLLVMAAAAQPAFKPGLVDRFLVAAEAGGVQPVLCVNKMDLVDEPPAATAIYKDLAPVVFLSCETGQGLDKVRALIQGKMSVTAGHSGVGKSTLINALLPDARIATQPVSNYNEKGRHTTTVARLYHLDPSTHVIDTPGIRQVGLWGITHAELSYYFPEIEVIASGCRFRDCTHTHEPGCAVQDAVENGGLLRARYASYLRIRESLEEEAAKLPPGRT